MSEMLFEFEAPTVTPALSAKWTERMVLDLLLARYSVSGGNGPRYAFAEHIKSAPGHDAPRTADFIAMSLWGSDGTALHGHEVKVSRSDWLTELRDPTKAEAFRPFMDYWWLVVSDRSIVRGDLPLGWGLMAPRADGKLAIVTRAKRCDPKPMPKGMTATLMRATAKTSQRALLRNERAVRWAAEVLERRDSGAQFGDHNETAASLLASVQEATGLR